MSVTWTNKIRFILNKQGRPLTHLAREAGIRYDTLQRWMRNESEPGISEAKSLARCLGLTLVQLFDEAVELPDKIEISLENHPAPPREVVKGWGRGGKLQKKPTEKHDRRDKRAI